MFHRHADDGRIDLARSLLRRAHNQSATTPERAPFWREGPWRCEFYRQPGHGRLKVYKGERCVHEEAVQSHTQATRRCDELRRLIAQRSGQRDALLT